MDNAFASLESVDLRFIVVDADHTVTDLCHAGSGHKSHVTRSDDCDIHPGCSPLSKHRPTTGVARHLPTGPAEPAAAPECRCNLCRRMILCNTRAPVPMH